MEKTKKTLQDYISEFPVQVIDQIDEIMEEFDFKRVETVMRALGWHWVNSEDNSGEVPDLQKIMSFARKLLKDVTFNYTSNSGHRFRVYDTGGFRVSYTLLDYPEDGTEPRDWKDDVKNMTDLKLEFIVEEWNTCQI